MYSWRCCLRKDHDKRSRREFKQWVRGEVAPRSGVGQVQIAMKRRLKFVPITADS
jgi:hypothetical protein